jgi:hypothetical protein
MNYASRCISLHRPGDPSPIVKHGQIGVLYDGTMYLYEISDHDLEDFVSWAIDTWAEIHDADAENIKERSDLYGRILYLD